MVASVAESLEFNVFSSRFEVGNCCQSTITSASISAELDKACGKAKKLSLAAKNARAMVLRVGDRAMGLKVVTDYFSELADNTISLANNINLVANNISGVTVARWRTETLILQLKKARKLDVKGTAFESLVLRQISEKIARDLHEKEELSEKLIRHLEIELEEIQRQMRAADVVCVTFLLEATKTGEFQEILKSMANNIKQLSDDIKAHVNRSQSLLEM
ncbi:MAG: hypothetical protein JKX83_04490 [Pseudomonadales bacterium]|nr:hypothetical protein [Pseudomonadales bacterium]